MSLLRQEYFDETRSRDLLKLLGRDVPDGEISVMERDYPTYYELYNKYYTTNRISVYHKGSFVPRNEAKFKMFERYKDAMDLFEFEQEYHGIQFMITKEMYVRVSSIRSYAQFLFSTKEYRIVDGRYFYTIDDKEVSFAPTDVSLMEEDGSLAEDVKRKRAWGVKPLNEKIPPINSVDNGQLKIAADLVKISVAKENNTGEHVLVVGSSSEAIGAGTSYRLLDFMFKKSHFYLYDPFEKDDVFETENGNVYHRFGTKFDYDKQSLVPYSMVVDDAYACKDNNRLTIDPNRKLLEHSHFSCKYLRGDHNYFKVPYSVGIGQVGKTFSGERRFMKPPPLYVTKKDWRFGNCGFCKELKMIVPKKRFGERFFKEWINLHPNGTHCGEKTEIVSQEGDLVKYDRGWYVEGALPYSCCLVHDQIPGFDVVASGAPDVSYNFVFSSFITVPKYLRECKVAIKYRGFYLSSVKRRIPHPQIREGSYKENGIWFDDYYGKYDEFDGYVDFRLSPKIEFSDLVPVFNYYSRIVIVRGKSMYRSVEKDIKD